jgi:hypothetical protein
MVTLLVIGWLTCACDSRKTSREMFPCAVSCPGDYCYYDNMTLIQHCTHCCHASYEHTDGELYIPNERKVACDAQHPGESHGICDGFGFCQCAPPFIGEDCSISACVCPCVCLCLCVFPCVHWPSLHAEDCMNNCSGWGICSVEYPVSRCLCDGTRAGPDCSRSMDLPYSFRARHAFTLGLFARVFAELCLNNCTYPNGQCIDGQCICNSTLNPYNRTRYWKPYGGSDCSYGRLGTPHAV